MLLLVTLYGLVFSLLRVTEAHALAYLFIAGFLAVIAVGQMLLFGGKKPRLASFVTGAACGCALALARVVLYPRFGFDLVMVPFILAWAFLMHGLLGYVAGCLLAGVFLVLGAFQKREPDPAEDSPFAIRDDERAESDEE
jgi:cbb3-type cytochrome oxidase subunit 3